MTRFETQILAIRLLHNF